jgi:hypothetical protein
MQLSYNCIVAAQSRPSSRCLVVRCLYATVRWNWSLLTPAAARTRHGCDVASSACQCGVARLTARRCLQADVTATIYMNKLSIAWVADATVKFSDGSVQKFPRVHGQYKSIDGSIVVLEGKGGFQNFVPACNPPVQIGTPGEPTRPFHKGPHPHHPRRDPKFGEHNKQQSHKVSVQA